MYHINSLLKLQRKYGRKKKKVLFENVCLLELFVGVVNAKLLEAVHGEELKTKYI
jgi:hypothetical protein